MENNPNSSSSNGELKQHPPQDGTVCQGVHIREQHSPDILCGTNDLFMPNWGVDRHMVGNCTTYNNGVPTSHEPNKVMKTNFSVGCHLFP